MNFKKTVVELRGVLKQNTEDYVRRVGFYDKKYDRLWKK